MDSYKQARHGHVVQAVQQQKQHIQIQMKATESANIAARMMMRVLGGMPSPGAGFSGDGIRAGVNSGCGVVSAAASSLSLSIPISTAADAMHIDIEIVNRARVAFIYVYI